RQIGETTSSSINMKPQPISTSTTVSYGSVIGVYPWGNMVNVDDISANDNSPIANLAAPATTVVKADGTGWAWGENAASRLDENTPFTSRPDEVSGLSEIVQVSTGGAHNLALTRTGNVFAWGANNSGQLGDGDAVASGA